MYRILYNLNRRSHCLRLNVTECNAKLEQLRREKQLVIVFSATQSYQPQLFIVKRTKMTAKKEIQLINRGDLALCSQNLTVSLVVK